jgi:hypothetical protein
MAGNMRSRLDMVQHKLVSCLKTLKNSLEMSMLGNASVNYKPEPEVTLFPFFNFRCCTSVPWI